MCDIIKSVTVDFIVIKIQEDINQMREPMVIAVIGCGRFAKNFVPLFKAHPAVKKVYVCDLIPERAEWYSEKFGVEIIGSFEEALASSEVNAIAIFTQRTLHGGMAIAALKAGKHVYSAVPCATDIEEIKEIERLVKETRLTYHMGETGYYRAPAIFCREEYARAPSARSLTVRLTTTTIYAIWRTASEARAERIGRNTPVFPLCTTPLTRRL